MIPTTPRQNTEFGQPALAAASVPDGITRETEVVCAFPTQVDTLHLNPGLRPHRITRLGMNKLTPRQREILAHLAKGFRYKEIASELDISTCTVRAHLHSTYRKLQVKSRTEAVLRYLGRQ